MRKYYICLIFLALNCFCLFGQSANFIIKVKPEAGFYEKQVEVKLSCDRKKVEIYYTTDGTKPDRSSNLYDDKIILKENTVIRAIAFSGKEISESATNTYFIDEKTDLPVISIAVRPSYLFNEATGLFTKGAKAKPEMPYFGANFWSRREVPIHVEFFETNKKRVLTEEVGLSVFGGMSRVFPQKSLALAARKRYGGKYMKYPFFPNRTQRKYKHLVLRNSGSDFGNTQFRDDLLTGLAEESGMEVQAARHAVVFINGSYWGIYSMREKMNRYFIENHFNGVDKDSIDFIEHRQDVKRGSIKNYSAMRSILWSQATNLGNQNQFDRIASMMNTDNFLLHQVIEIYIDNQDAGGNIKFFRPQRKDARWDWLLFDTDFGFGLYETEAFKNNSLTFHTDPNGPAWPNPPWTTLNIRKLLENKTFKQNFVNRFADLMNTSFKPENVISKIDSFENALKSEMPRHATRWKRNLQQWKSNVERMRIFAKERPAYMKRFLQEKFNCGQDVKLSLEVNKGNGTILLNNFVKVRSDFEGFYFQNIPVSVEAIPDFGQRFVTWKGISEGEPSDKKRTLSLGKGDLNIEAVFEEVPSPWLKKIIVNELEIGGKNRLEWIEFYNQSNQKVVLTDWILQSGGELVNLPEMTLQAGGYAVIVSDSNAFKQKSPNTPYIFYKNISTFLANGQLLTFHTNEQAPVDSLSLPKIELGKSAVWSRIRPDAGAFELGEKASPASINESYRAFERQKQKEAQLIKGIGILIIIVLLMAMFRFVKVNG